MFKGWSVYGDCVKIQYRQTAYKSSKEMRMSKSVDVSVIVPVYNVEKYIRVCLDTLVHQTLSNIEIIVVNDGTKDDSQKIIDEFSSLYPDKIIALKKENGGLSDARNYGLEHASGAYVGFVDSDDYTDIEMYQKLYEKAKQENADIVVCGYYGVQEQNGQFQVIVGSKVTKVYQALTALTAFNDEEKRHPHQYGPRPCGGQRCACKCPEQRRHRRGRH